MRPKFWRSLTVFVKHGITAKAMKTLESHNLMIQFLIAKFILSLLVILAGEAR